MIKNLELTATKLKSWVENDKQFTVVRNAKGRPIAVTAKRGKYQEEEMLFSYATDNVTCISISGNIVTELLPALFTEVVSPGNLVPIGIAVSGNKTIAASDFGQIQYVSASAALTVPNDTVLGIVASDRVTVAAYQQTAGAVTWAAGAGVSPLRGTAPTAAQYLFTSLVHVGNNEWAYL